METDDAMSKSLVVFARWVRWLLVSFWGAATVLMQVVEFEGWEGTSFLPTFVGGLLVYACWFLPTDWARSWRETAVSEPLPFPRQVRLQGWAIAITLIGGVVVLSWVGHVGVWRPGLALILAVLCNLAIRMMVWIVTRTSSATSAKPTHERRGEG